MAGTLERISFSGKGKQGASQDTIALHMERYQYASQFVSGAQVLDIACGVGYGSRILKDAGALSVFGVDIAPEAIEEAHATTTGEDTPKFFCLSYTDLANSDKIPSELREALRRKFDVIVSLETIEHLPDPDDFIRVVTAQLREGGRFIGSVPVTPSMDANPFHLQDFTPRSFRKLLERNGLAVDCFLRQTQPYNPVSVKKEMDTGERGGLRSNLGIYYATHPNKLLTRITSTLRHGFVNRYDVVVAVKTESSRFE